MAITSLLGRSRKLELIILDLASLASMSLSLWIYHEPTKTNLTVQRIESADNPLLSSSVSYSVQLQCISSFFLVFMENTNKKAVCHVVGQHFLTVLSAWTSDVMFFRLLLHSLYPNLTCLIFCPHPPPRCS